MRQELDDEAVGGGHDPRHALQGKILRPLDIHEDEPIGVAVQPAIHSMRFDLHDIGIVMEIRRFRIYREPLAAV